MAYAPFKENRILGQFTEKTCDQTFEFANRSEVPGWADLTFAPEYTHTVWVGSAGEYRYARVLKTVVYIITDEDENGNPVVEKWDIKGHRLYERAA